MGTTTRKQVKAPSITTYRAMGDAEKMHVCQTCGATVSQMDMQRHSNWHKELEK